jgi:hypothetical protein
MPPNLPILLSTSQYTGAHAHDLMLVPSVKLCKLVTTATLQQYLTVCTQLRAQLYLAVGTQLLLLWLN